MTGRPGRADVGLRTERAVRAVGRAPGALPTTGAPPPTGLPWDVPVRLLVGRAGATTAHRVAVGVDLPGLATVEVTTAPVDGVTAVTGIVPLRPPRGTGLLADLLRGLRDAEGAVPVLVDTTPFGRAVLVALCRVPVGARVTYAALAGAAGRPRAVRATATVMARNRVPLVLPCHRVVPTGGGTGRYGWGEDVKRALLALEVAA